MKYFTFTTVAGIYNIFSRVFLGCLTYRCCTVGRNYILGSKYTGVLCRIHGRKYKLETRGFSFSRRKVSQNICPPINCDCVLPNPCQSAEYVAFFVFMVYQISAAAEYNRYVARESIRIICDQLSAYMKNYCTVNGWYYLSTELIPYAFQRALPIIN
jgi:hypothetical protein